LESATIKKEILMFTLMLLTTPKGSVQGYKNQLESMFHIVQQEYLHGREMIPVYIASIVSPRRELYGNLRKYLKTNNNP
jgi:hypothetical protein